MKTVFKYTLDLTDDQIVQMPAGSTALHVKEQNGELCIWALVDPDKPTCSRRFFVHGTGHTLHPGALDYIGTAHLHNGGIVLHVFEGVS
jgi:hypothetical protein